MWLVVREHPGRTAFVLGQSTHRDRNTLMIEHAGEHAFDYPLHGGRCRRDRPDQLAALPEALLIARHREPATFQPELLQSLSP